MMMIGNVVGQNGGLLWRVLIQETGAAHVTILFLFFDDDDW